MKLPLFYCLFYLKFLFILSFTFSVHFQTNAQNTKEQNKRFFKLIDLKDKANNGYFQSGRQITKLLFEGAKKGELPIYEVEYKENEPKNIEVKRLETDYMDRFQTLSTNQLSVLGIDYVESRINSTTNIHIQYLHLFVAGDYFSDSKPKPVVSFRYEDAKPFLNNDHRSVWLPTTSNDNSLFENLFLADENQQAKISQKLAELVKNGTIIPYDLEKFEYKKKEKGEKKQINEPQKMTAEQFLSRWNSLTDAPIGEVRIQNIDERIIAKNSHDFFTSKWITVWNTKSNYLKPVASFRVAEIKPFFINESTKDDYEGISTYTKALQNQNFESRIVWQNEDLKDELYYKDNFDTNKLIDKLAYYIRTEINLNENVNTELSQNENEISKLILKAVENEKIQAYQVNYDAQKGRFNETEMNFAEVKSNLFKKREVKSPAEVLNISEEQLKIGISLQQVADLEKYREEQAKEIREAAELYKDPSNKFFYMSDISLLEIENELVYDIEKERYFYQSAYVSLYIPAEKSEIGLNRLIAKFRIQDVLKILQKSERIHLSEYQRQFIHQNYSSKKRIPKRVNYSYFLCKQLYIGNKWLIDGIFWK